MKGRMETRKAIYKGYGSSIRSALCPIEFSCTYWEINSKKYFSFSPKLQNLNIKVGTECDVTFRYDGNSELKYAKIHHIVNGN